MAFMAQPLRERAPRRRTPRRGAHSRGTCPGWRRPGTAAPYRRAAPRPMPPARPARWVARARVVHTPRSARLDLRRILADQHGVPHLAAKRSGQRREILSLALAARDHHQRAPSGPRRRRGSRRRSCPWSRRRSARPQCRRSTAERCGEAREGLESRLHGRHAACPRPRPGRERRGRSRHCARPRFSCARHRGSARRASRARSRRRCAAG